jgi:tetratricopeptide (TPR) repeat protein
MSENVLESFLGSEPEEEDGALPEIGPIGADAAAALALEQGSKSPELEQETTGYFRDQRQVLKKQARMLDVQMEHLHEQRTLNLRHMRVRRWRETLQLGFQVFIAFAATVIGLGIMVMLYDAFTSKSVIVEPFDSPPPLAARGLSGKVVAGLVLDELTRLQAATRSTVAKRNLSNAWTSDIKVEVPETGVSVGDIDRMLKARFGHDLHIGGDLVQTDTGGLALTVRGDGVLPKVFTGATVDLEKLATKAAEYVYGQSQPYLFAVYLTNAGRNAEAVAFSKAAYPSAKPEDRPNLLNEWANALANTGGTPQAALALYREALKLKPDFWVAYNNVINSTWLLGDEEGAWRAGEAMRKAAGGRPGKAPELYYQNGDTLTWNLQAWRASTMADEAVNGGIGTSTVADAPAIADIDTRLHDPADAEFQLQTAQGDAKDPSIAAMTHFVHGRLAAEAGDVQRAAAEMEAFGAAYADATVSSNYPGYTCWIAPAEEAAGHPDKADAALKAGGHFVDCYRFRGDILDHRGDWVGAQKAYAQSVAIAPDLPAGYYSWGVALALHGDLNGATAKLAAANQRGPHWADPLKAWGDVLAREGRWRDALAKYDEALKYAPAWRELHQARDAAARKA